MQTHPNIFENTYFSLIKLPILLPIGSALGLVAIPLWNNNKEYRGALAQTTGPRNNLWRRGSLYTQAVPRQWPRCVGLIEGKESQ